MKPKTPSKKQKLLSFLLFTFGALLTVSAQVAVPFSPRLPGNNIKVKGDLTLLSNNILNTRIVGPSQHNNAAHGNNAPWDPNIAYHNGNANNQRLPMAYIDIDGDPTTFSSSSASLNAPSCSRVIYAGLYWGGTYPFNEGNSFGNSNSNDPLPHPGDSHPPNDLNRDQPYESVKFKVPGGAYVDIGPGSPAIYEYQKIYDKDGDLDGDGNTDPGLADVDLIHSPYLNYANVTHLLAALDDNPNGEYTAANIVGTLERKRGGNLAGWTMVVIYENPNSTSKYISTFDGLTAISNGNSATFGYNGFRTLPTGLPVRARIGVSAMEGDRNFIGPQLQFKANSTPVGATPDGGFTKLSTTLNPVDNFFNSTITDNDAYVTTRNPAGENTLGWDTDIFELDNPANSVLPNDETGAEVKILLLNGSGDITYLFLNTISVDIIEPSIILEKRVEDIAGNDITGMGVNLGQTLDYVLSFRNRGNDDALNYTIRDVLPVNTDFISVDVDGAPGVTHVFNAGDNSVTFTVPNDLIQENDPAYEIRLRVKVAENCFDFVDACTDLIENIAFSTYTGTLNTSPITNDPSVSSLSTCGLPIPGATNFLLDDLTACNFTRTVQLCGANVVLDAGDGFDGYTWTDGGGNVINDGDPDSDPSTLLVDTPGTYTVNKQVADPCKDFNEIIIVEFFGLTQTNPISALINDTTNTVEGEVVTCPNDGEELPNIFLCGLNDTELIQINIPDADSIEWEQLDEASCTASVADCANKNLTCTWNNVGAGSDFVASDAGQYRVVINYQNGCATRFYFNIFKNPLDPQYTSSDLICNTLGNITVTNMPIDYEYQLLDATTGNVLVPYANNNGPSFTLASNGIYTVEMRQQGVVDGCVFRLEDLGIRTRDFQVDVTSKDTDCIGLGEISISVLDVQPQYYYEISQGGTTVDTFGPSTDNNYTFENLNDGLYDILVTTDDGCNFTSQVTINDITDLALDARISQHITCREGNIQLDAIGGSTPYSYAIWSFVDPGGTTVISYPTINDIPASAYQTSVIFDILNPGDYTFVVVDRNNCSAISNPVTIVLEPSVVYTTSFTDETCFGAADGTATYNITSANGYKVDYTLTFPDTSTISNSSGVFTGLPQGDYTITLTQSKGPVSCDFVETFTIGGPANGISATAAIIDQYTCLQNGSVEAQNVTGGTPPYEYSIDGVNFASGPGAETFGNLTDGTYTITVRDDNGCTFPTNTVTLDPLNPPSDLTFGATVPTCPALTSNVTVSVVGGNTPFIFEITAPAASAINNGNDPLFIGLAPGTYTFSVTDDKGCTYNESYTIAPVSPINVVGQLTNNITCFADTDGAVLFTVSGFNTSYDYTVTGPSAFNGVAETNATIPLTGLDDGIYNITVTDNDTNCTDTASVTVEAPPAALTLAAAETQPTCVADGSVVLTAANGWGGYDYSLTYPDATVVNNTTGNFAGLSLGGTYNASVTDANGCVVATSFVLNTAVAPVLAIVPNDNCYLSANGLTLTANVVSGGDGNYEYSLNGGVYTATNVFTGLTPGIHTITVRDGNSCTDTDSITINPELTVTASAGNIPACGTGTDITVTAAGGDGNFVYAVVGNGVTPNAGDFNITNPRTVTGAGDYDIYVRDNSGNAGYCEASFDLNVAQDAPVAINVVNTPILCSGAAQSTLTITASGGEAPFEYSIDNGANYQSSDTFVNLPAGSYNIRVRDTNNCPITQIYTITEPFTLSASAAVTELVECNPSAGAEVRITNAQGGTSPYEYSFDGGSNYGPTAIGFLLAGTHTVFIRDANNCTFPMTVVVDPQPTAPNLSAAIVYECDGEGTITITPDSPAFDYTYEIDATPNTPNTSNVFSNVAVGSHTITVNYVSNTTPAPSNLLVENFGSGVNTSISEVDPAYCYEPQDGSASLCGFGTNTRIQDGEYSVTQLIANPYSTWLSPNDHTGIPNGRFLAMNVGGVVGPNGIIYAKRNIEVLPNRDITISLWAFNLLRSGTGGADPDINITLVDGGGSVIANTTTGNVPKNNGANDWQNYTVTLNPGANTNLDIVIRTNSAVTGGNDIAIDDIQAFQIPQVCASSVTIDVQIEDGHAFDANITNFTNASCNTVSDGTITFEVDNFDAVNGFVYTVNGGAPSAPQTASPIVLNALAAGVYNIVVTDVLDNSCSVNLSETITEPTPVVATASMTEAFTCNNTGATITASTTGGTPIYLYQLETSGGAVVRPYQTNAVFTNVAAGNYIVRARDNNLCEDPIDATINIAAPANPTFTTTPTACYSGANDGTILVDVTSLPGNGGFQFSINGGPWITPTPATATSHTFQNLANGTYTIDVKDQFGCPGVQQSVTLNPNLTATIAVTDISSCADGDITVTATGGDASYEYAFVATTTDPTGFFGASSSFTVTTGNDGVYDVYVRDNAAVVPYCEYVETVTVNPAVPLTYTSTPTDPECFNGTGSIAVNITSGESPYTIQIIDLDNGGASNQTNTNVVATTQTYFNLAPGNYTINVTDANGCLVTDTPITINNPEELTADIGGETPADCTGDPDDFGFKFTNYPSTLGTIQFSADGGATWIGDNSVPGTSDIFTGYNSGDIVNPSLRTVDGSNNTVCITHMPPFVIPYPLDDLDITVFAVVVNCNELQVTVQGSQGSPDYQYTYSDDPANFDPNAPINPWTTPAKGASDPHTFTGLVPGRTYVFYVRDNATCVRQSSVNVNILITVPLEITTAYTPTCAGASNGTLTYTVTDNQAPFGNEFRWEVFDMSTGVPVSVTNSGGNVPYVSPATVSLTGLPTGNYFIEVTEVDGGADSCVGATENQFLEELNPITGTPAVLADITCANPGLVEINSIFGGGGTYTYTLSSPNFTGDIVTTDNPVEVPISQLVDATISPTNITVTVADQYGCGASLGTIPINVSQNPTIDNIAVANCAVPLGITITANNGLAPYLYSIDGGTTYLNNGGIFSNVTAGTYNVSIIDSNGCTDTSTVEVYPVLTADVSLTKLLDCSVSPNAEITINVTAGSLDYDYEITDGTGTVVAKTALPSNPYTFLAPIAENYVITIYDNNTTPACNRVFPITVPAAIQPIFTHTFTDVSCNGADDGTISLFQTDNGINPLTYSISPVAGNFIAATNTYEDLPPNTYTVTATGTNGCTTDIAGIIIGEPNAIAVPDVAVVDFSCSAGNNPDNATITIDDTTITGGSGTYVIYEFYNDQGTAPTGDDVLVQSGSNTVYTETNVAGGTYIVYVYDDNGCVGSTTATITILPYDELLTATAAITNATSCSPGLDGEITITVTSTNSDTSKFEYSINNGTTYQASNVFGGLDVGTHNFLIRHVDTGCIITTSETIVDPNTFTIDVQKIDDVVCFGTATGEVTFELLDATYGGGFDWEIFDTNGTLVDLTDDISINTGTEAAFGPTAGINLPAGSYYVAISQTNNPQCVNTEAFSINGPSAAITGNTLIEPITCAGNDGVIEITTVLGGWGGYTYFVGTAAPAGPGDYLANPRFENLAVGTYEAWVLDSEGCQHMVQNGLAFADPIAITATLQINQENCTNLQGELEVVGTTGGQNSNFTYQLIKDGVDFGAPQNTTTFSGLGAGSYQVRISDQWSCATVIGTEVLFEEMNLTATVVKPIDCTVNPGGEITITVNGGSANLDFEVTFPDGFTIVNNATGIFTGLTQPGTYSFLVTDQDTTTPICAKTITEVLDTPTLVTFDPPTRTHVSCNGGSDGSVVVNLVPTAAGINDNPIYTYTLYDAVGTTVVQPTQNNPDFSGLSAAFYQVEVASSRGCLNRQTFEITEPAALTVSATATPFDCNASNVANTSTVTITAGGGTGPYLYSLDNVNFQTSNTFEVIDTGLAQNITAYVTDDNNCANTFAIPTIQPLNVFNAVVSLATAITCAGPEEVTIAVTDNANPANAYTFELLPLGNPNGNEMPTALNTTTQFELNAVGSYVFRVTDTATGCYVDTAPYTIAPFDLVAVQATATTAVTCFGDTNGALEINVTGYTGAYTYEVFTAAGVTTGITGAGNTTTNPSPPISGLSGGNYFVRLTETANPLCRENSNVVTIISPDIALTATTNEVANVTCTNDQGEILVDPVGGYPPYDIVLTNTTTTQVYNATDVLSNLFTGLAAGNYTVAITDDGGCVFNDTETLIQPTSISAGISPDVVLSCFGDTNASVSAINVLGGQGPGNYQYQLNYYDAAGAAILFTSGAQTSDTFDNLGAGIYSITITDGWNCGIETPLRATVSEPNEVSSTLVQTSPLTCTTDATLLLTATGGNGAPYQFSADNITFTPMAGGNTHTFNIAAGNEGVYQYYVIDALGCETMISNQVSVDVVPMLDMVIDESAAIINCTGEATATITATAIGGLGNYSYELFSDAALTNLLVGPQASGTFGTLIAGSYYIRVTSVDCIDVSHEIIITDPAPLQIDRQEFTDVTCAGQADGTITVEVSGGTGNILYAITPNLNQFDTENVFTDLGPGVYDVIAQDENGCFIPLQFTLIEPAPIDASFTALPEVCFGSEDGSIDVVISGGTAPYRTSLNTNNDADFVQDRTSFTNLAAGTYVIFIKDAQDCEANLIVEIDPGVNLNATVVPVYECTGDTTNNYVNITLEDDSVLGSVMYALDSTDPLDMQLNPDFRDTAPGSHYIAISHANGCVFTVDFDITAFEPLTLSLEQNNINEITAIATGGLEEYTFIFDDEDNGPNNTYIIRRTDTYTVRVIDQNGCEATAEIFMEFIDIEIPNFFTPDGDGLNDLWVPQNLEAFPEILTIIFDRYGREVYRMGQNDPGWEGLYHNTELPTGDYWYIIKLNGEEDDREFVGHFTLYR
ncbi:T9SS type B sorting domain-containing protein [Spongiimicrobium sp. 3-5]|uniref:T9SS type B sorting domain-containing protein n=1 Tax=Spongiimicrobium sp. 3-5 TaxID=3332596 RepID=UPI00397FCD1E